MAGSPATAPKRYNTRRYGTTVPAGRTSIFFTLPAELRLEVYNYALEDCLRDGQVADVAGLFCCCRQIHQEIESEFMTATRQLLTAKNKWEDSEKVNGVLSMQILPKLNSKEAGLSIKLPLQAAFKVDLMGTTATDIAGLLAVSDILRGMLVRNWSVLRIRLESRASRPVSISQMDRTFKYIIAISRSSTSPAFHHVKHIDRIVLHYDNPSIRLAKTALYDMRVLYQAYCNAQHIGPSNIFKQGWLSKDSGGRQSGWRLTIDQKQGLDPVAGAIWRMAFVDGNLQSKFNPLGDVPANILSECLGRHKMAESGPVIDISSDDSDDLSDSDSDDSSDSDSDDFADSESDSSSDSGSDTSPDTESTDSSDPENDEYSDSGI